MLWARSRGRERSSPHATDGGRGYGGGTQVTNLQQWTEGQQALHSCPPGEPSIPGLVVYFIIPYLLCTLQHSSNDIGASLSSSASQQGVAMSGSESTTSNLHHVGSLNKDKKRLGQRRSGAGHVGGADHGGEFSRQDKVEQLEAAIGKIKSNNRKLVEHAQ